MSYQGFAYEEHNGIAFQIPLISRRYTVISVTISAGEALSDAVDMRHFAGGLVITPSAWTSADIGFKVSDTENGTYVPLYDDTGAAVYISGVDVDRACVMPENLYGAHFVKLWSSSAGASDVNQGDDRTLTLMLKA